MPIERELLEFAKSRPLWQQDLIRRICTQPHAFMADIDQVLNNLKSSEGMADCTQSEPLKEEHLHQRGPNAPQYIPVALGAISDVRNANQLAASQHLPFALKGITLIYGDNGSGKTGYARIVKQLCRARRDKPEPLLGNVYKSSRTPAHAKITYRVGDEQRQFDWEDGKESPPELSRISVFDASTAPLYADHQNEIEFLPWGLDVLPHLGRACQYLTQRLQEEIDDLSEVLAVPLPQQIAGSPAEAVVQRLGLETPESQLPTLESIREAGSWSVENDEEVREVEADLQKLSEPAKAAAQCRRFKASLDAFRERLVRVERLFCPEAIARYKEQFDKAHAAREAASIAAQVRFDGDPLGKVVGIPAWRQLYQYAEQFNAVAYPGEPFPATGNDKVCLLCQQPFDRQAADRMSRFKQFMHDTSQQEAQKEETQLNGQLRDLDNIRIPTNEEMDAQFLELSSMESSFGTLKAKLAQFITEASPYKTAVISALNGQVPFGSLAAWDDAPIRMALDYSSGLDDKAKQFDQAVADTATTNKLKMKHTELLGRQQLSGAIATVLARHADLGKYRKLNRCKEQCDTYQISRKNTDFRERYLTVDFETELKRQVKLLGLGYLPIKIDAKTEKGTSYVGVGLNKAVNVRNANILSEGEFRALALACFFAEIATIPNHDGIVIDDPVSSLDHRHMKQVARRLVDEAKMRSQVIVFTHDLPFYYELCSAVEEAQVPIARNWVRSVPPNDFGLIATDDGPWQVKKTKERISALNTMLMQIPEEGLSPEDQEAHVRRFYTRLRETWERLVEECLFNKVVARFQAGVQTQSLRGVAVTDEDYLMVFFNMKKVSELSGHDLATGRQGTLPPKDEMARDLAILQNYEKTLAKRTNEIDAKRRSLGQPPTAETLPAPSN